MHSFSKNMIHRFTTYIALALSLPAFAHAHPGHGLDGFTGGIAHPMLGMDHLLAMLAVGLWAAQLGARARWVLPGVFAGAMSVGVACGFAGFSLPFIEQGVVGSVLVLGLLIAASARLQIKAAAAIVAGFAFLHGMVHGVEMQAGAGEMNYGAGLILSTALFQWVGLAMGTALLKTGRTSWLRAAGAFVCLLGALLAGV